MKKILLILGASSDLGIKYLGDYGSQYDCIYAHYNHMNEKLQRACQEVDCKIIQLKVDLLNPESVYSMFEVLSRAGKIPTHILFFCAPKFHYSKFEKISLAEWTAQFQISFFSFVEIMKEFLPKMAKKGYGKVVVMLSSCTKDIPPKYLSHYVSIKYSLLGLIKSLVAEYAQKGITINGVSPDMIETKFLSEVPGFVLEENAKRQPSKKNISMEEVTAVIEMLLSDKLNSINGQNIFITNGL